MGTINEKLQYLAETKTQLENALLDKGITPSSNFRENVGLVDTYTTDATATANDIINPKTAYVNGQKITGSIIPTYRTVSATWYKRTISNTSSAIFGVNEQYLLYYSSSLGAYVLENLNTGNKDTISTSIYSWSSGDFASIVLGCIYNVNQCYGVIVRNDTNSALFLKIENDEIVDYKVQSINSYARSLMVTPGKNHPNLFCSEYRSGSSGEKSMRIFTLNEDLSFAKSYVSLMFKSDYSNIGYFSDNDEYYTSLSPTGVSTVFSTTVTKKLNWSDNNLNSITAITNPVNGLLYYNSDMTYLISSSKNLYSVTTVSSMVSVTNIGTVQYTGTALCFIGNSLITYSGNNVYVYNLSTTDNSLSLLDTFVLQNNVNLLRINNNNNNILFERGSVMEYLYNSSQDVLNTLNVGGTILYNSANTNATAGDILLGKTAYTNQGKIIGTIPNNGAITITPTTSQQTIPTGYTSGGIVNACAITQEDYDDCQDLADDIAINLQFLPYTPIEYIQSSGSQYINTNYKPNTNMKLIIEFEHTGNAISWERLFGTSDKTEFSRENNTTTFSYRINNNAKSSATITNGTIYNLEITNSYLKLNDTINNFTATTFNSSQFLHLFHGADAYGRFKLYYCKIYDGETLVRDFVPAKDDNNVVCLYEKVSQTFYYNAGTGTFTAGNVIPGSIVAKDLQDKLEIIDNDVTTNLLSENIKSGTNILGVSGKSSVVDTSDADAVAGDIASGKTAYVNGVKVTGTLQVAPYTELEYIESTGTQYINTKIPSERNVKMEIDFVNTFGLSTTYQGVLKYYGGSLFGGRVSGTNNNYSYTTGGDNDFIGIGNNFIQINKNESSKLTKISYSNTSVSITNDDYSYENNELNFTITTSNNICIFARNDNGTIENGTFKIYSCKMWNNDVLVRDLIPVKAGINTICMYDRVSQTFFYNQGTGNFVAGPEV